MTAPPAGAQGTGVRAGVDLVLETGGNRHICPFSTLRFGGCVDLTLNEGIRSLPKAPRVMGALQLFRSL